MTVRLAGQDSRRGTFVQRHASVVDAQTGADYLPLFAVKADSARFFVHDSLLSEYAAMGFEYGYSVENLDALVLWEAQFGDFANGAQAVVDEFISSGEVKWGQQNALTLLLPHGHEGQGPDHTSGRIERYLQLCAEDNMRVVVPSTPANYFHLLRRQALSPKKKPLVVFTPKSLLRHRLCVSAVSDFTSGRFQPVIGDSLDAGAVRKVLLCSGKVYYDLVQARADRTITDTAIVRLEQLYPLPVDEIRAALAAYPGRDRLRLGPGRAGQPGRLVLHRAEPAGAPRRGVPAADLAAVGGGSGRRLDEAARRRAGGPHRRRAAPRLTYRKARRHTGGGPSSGDEMYFTDRGIEELAERRGEETVTLDWLAERLRDFVDLNPEFETPVERFATWLARLDDEAD